MVCTYVFFSKKDHVVEGKYKEEKGTKVICVEDAWDTEKYNIMK